MLYENYDIMKSEPQMYARIYAILPSGLSIGVL